MAVGNPATWDAVCRARGDWQHRGHGAWCLVRSNGEEIELPSTRNRVPGIESSGQCRLDARCCSVRGLWRWVLLVRSGMPPPAGQVAPEQLPRTLRHEGVLPCKVPECSKAYGVQEEGGRVIEVCSAVGVPKLTL